MPYKRHDPSKPTAYLDTSTLSYASEGLALSPNPPEARRLLDWVTHLATDANLVISNFHVAEFSRWVPTSADPCAEWLWGLPLVPARMFAYVLDEEDDHWLAVAFKLADPPAIRLFAPTLLTSLEKLSVEAAAEGLAVSDLPSLIRLERTNLSEKSRQVGLSLLARFQTDAEDIRRAGATEADAEIRAGQNFRSELRRRAIEAHGRLTKISPAYRELGLSEGGVQDPFVDLYRSNTKALPMTRVIEAFSRGFANASRRSSGGRKRQAKAASASVDYMHMTLGAAYCDIFTCDLETSGWLGSTRCDAGLPNQIVLGGGTSYPDFVAALENAFR